MPRTQLVVDLAALRAGADVRTAALLCHCLALVPTAHACLF